MTSMAVTAAMLVSALGLPGGRHQAPYYFAGRGTPGLSHLVGFAQRAQVGREVASRGKGVGMVVTQRPVAPREGVLVECACPLILAHRTQGEAEVAGGAQRVGVVLAEHPTAAGEGVSLEVAGLLVLAQGSQGEAEQAGLAQSEGVVLAEDSAEASE